MQHPIPDTFGVKLEDIKLTPQEEKTLATELTMCFGLVDDAITFNTHTLPKVESVSVNQPNQTGELK